MQQNLVEHTAENIAIALARRGHFNRLGNGAAETAGGSGMFFENFSSHGRFGGGGGSNRGAVKSHDLAAEGLLLI